MPTYECSRCGAVETLDRMIPDCCSFCGDRLSRIDETTEDETEHRGTVMTRNMSPVGQFFIDGRYVIPSGMGGVFDVKLLMFRDDRTSAEFEIDMPSAGDFHGKIVSCALEKVRHALPKTTAEQEQARAPDFYRLPDGWTWQDVSQARATWRHAPTHFPLAAAGGVSAWGVPLRKGIHR